MEAGAFTEFRLENAKKENDFIYHERVPAFSSLPEIKGLFLISSTSGNIICCLENKQSVLYG